MVSEASLMRWNVRLVFVWVVASDMLRGCGVDLFWFEREQVEMLDLKSV